MKSITATTFAGTQIVLNKKAYQKAVKICSTLGLPKPGLTPNSDELVKYLRAKQSAFQHALAAPE